MLKFGDWVRIKYGEYEGRCAKVVSRRKSGEYGLILYEGAFDARTSGEAEAAADRPGQMLNFPEEALLLIEPYVISQKNLRKLARAELTYADFAEQVFPPFNVKVERKYTIRIEDLKAALLNINQIKPPLAAFKQWFWLLLNVFYDSLNIKNRYDETVFTDFPKDDAEIFSTVFGLTEKLYWRLEERLGSKEENEQYLIRFQNEPVWEVDGKEADELEITAYYAVCSDIIGRIDSYLINDGHPQGQWVYSQSQMKHVIGAYESDEDLKGATPEALALYREFVRRLYRVGDLQAIRILAFGYMTGGIAYRQNFELARMYLQELYDRTGDAYAANCLGYIYYHGLSNNGIPQYDKAFPLFAYAVLDGVDEAIYMAGDMLIHGQGTVKNIDMGLNLLVEGYRNALYDFCREDFECRFAEYAAHMGACCMEGLIFGMGTKDAYRFYLEAEYAAEKRKKTKRPVDQALLDQISRNLEYIRDKVKLDPDQTVLKADFPVFISLLYEERYPVKVTITKKRGSSDLILKIRRFDFQDLFRDLNIQVTGGGNQKDELKTEGTPKMLVTYPELSWSGLVSEMEYTLENGNVLKRPEKPGPFLSDGFRREETTNVLEFYARGEIIAAIEADWFSVSVKKKKKPGTDK